MMDNTTKEALVKLGTTNPELRHHIRQIFAGCEKLPEGGMRDNCEKKKEEGGGKEAGVPEKHQLKILKDTVKNPLKGKFLGGPSAAEAEAALRKDFKYTDKQIDALKKSASLEDELIKLGTTNPELRPHIRPLLKQASWAENIEASAKSLAVEARKGGGGPEEVSALITHFEVLRMYMIRDLGFNFPAIKLKPVIEYLEETQKP